MASIRNSLKALISHSKFNVSQEISCSKLLRSLSVRQYSKGAYEGDGKTHATLLNDDTGGLLINGYSQIGFSLSNGTSVLGPMAIFPNTVLSWNVGEITDIDERSLSLFLKLYPKLDILVLGIPSASKKMYKNHVNSIFRIIRENKIQCEILTPEMACPTFNFLLAEQRFVGAGIIPPLEIIGEGDHDLGMTPLKMGLPAERNV
ncbi:NADH dehydrogenase [ubiquinone] 1 alpha subcomplex assembly factor 3 [Frankliniella fusca]|uniref:NADH dehydrogenase [ubiquinone] 1 alpha subcomplex assembly factor 3 n=1 Tax=Frankliniella fusca TaxID=407009 RepID=A0AAE1HWQ4_9NEOP|nr:NADH dehydrogenase [ubiquinone] 1 alpha subcomplex assembly factor 3 [Frankliniella fusca]